MNAKKAKALRRVLKNLEKLNPQANLSGQSNTYSENEQNRKLITVEDFDKDGNVISRVIPVAAGTITVNKDSKRGLYLHLKKAMNNQEKVSAPQLLGRPRNELLMPEEPVK